MIPLDVKLKTTASAPIMGLSLPENKPTLSFSELLKGVSLKKEDNVVQNGALVLSLDESAEKPKVSLQSRDLLSLLKNDSPSLPDATEVLELNPKITQKLTPKELKTLVLEAKDYLKSKIVQSPEYKKSQVQELPRTLKGLAEMAKAFNVDVSKITLEKLQPKSEQTSKEKSLTQSMPLFKTQVKTNVIDESKQPKVDNKITPLQEALKKLSPNMRREVQPKAEVKTELKAELKADLKTEAPTPTQNAREVQPKAQLKAETPTQNAREVQPKAQLKAQLKTEAPTPIQNTREVQLKEAFKVDESKNMSLVKAQIPLQHSTEQFVAAKKFKLEEKIETPRANEGLRSLLGGEKIVKAESAPIISNLSAPVVEVTPTSNARVENASSLESLLHGDKKSDNSLSKLDGMAIKKVDDFEVKLHESKQMIKYISQDVKTAIEDYKSPFTRVKLQLNPERFGEVELTIVQRGKNLHINLSSNNAAINALALNAQDLKTQLSNSGINNATLNFSNNAQSDDSSAGQGQRQRQERQKAQDEYNYFDNKESNEEILSSLEIVVSRYA